MMIITLLASEIQYRQLIPEGRQTDYALLIEGSRLLHLPTSFPLLPVISMLALLDSYNHYEEFVATPTQIQQTFLTLTVNHL